MHLFEEFKSHDNIYLPTSEKEAKELIKYGFKQDTVWYTKDIAVEKIDCFKNPVLIETSFYIFEGLIVPNTSLMYYYSHCIKHISQKTIDKNKEKFDEIFGGYLQFKNSDKDVFDSLTYLNSVILEAPAFLEISEKNIIKMYI